MDEPSKDILLKYWGYGQFRPSQSEIIDHILKGRNTLAILPTGGGKSICYQVPGLLIEGITLVVSPLVSLMKDQVDALVKKDIPAIAIHSGLAWDEIKLAMENAIAGRYRFVYVSPERLTSVNFREYLPALPIRLLVVDEAHCISQWGFDFRPAYLRIPEVLPFLKNAVVAAFTASAPPKVREDIGRFLFQGDYATFQSDFNRPNLHFFAVETDNKSGYLLRLLRKQKGATLVFCDTRREVEETCRFLNAEGFACNYYHAGLSRDVRTKVQDQWIKGEVNLMVCTNAFGMGVDKPDVRMVLHFSPPATPEAYYQEAGRAGRDGKDSWCFMLYRNGETQRIRERIIEAFPPVSELERIYNAVFNYYGLAAGAGAGISADFDLSAIASRFNMRQLHVLHGVQNIAMLGYWELSESIYQPSRLRMTAGYQDVYDYKLRNADHELLIDVILRNYGGVFDSYVKVKEEMLARKLHISIPALENQLLALQKNGIIDYRKRSDNPVISFLEGRSPYPVFNIKKLEPLRNSKLEAVHMVEMYLNFQGCRSAFWVQYFTGHSQPDCNTCDNCRKKLSESKSEPEMVIRNFLGNEGKSMDEILLHFNDNQLILNQWRMLMDAGLIKSGEDGLYRWNR